MTNAKLRSLAKRTPQSRVVWSKTVRILPTRFPPVALFERIADPSEWEQLIAIEALTNERVRDHTGDISLVAQEDRVSGPGASWVMGAFTHIGRPSRFGDGAFGIYYTAQDERCAIAETCFHWGNFLHATNEGPTDLDMRTLVARLDSTLFDLRGQQSRFAALYEPDDYSASQEFGRLLREQGANGIVYDSVRLQGGRCAALFKAGALKQLPVGDRVLRYHWDGQRFDRIFDYQKELWSPPPAST